MKNHDSRPEVPTSQRPCLSELTSVSVLALWIALFVILGGCSSSYTAQPYVSQDKLDMVTIFPGPIRSGDLKFTASLRMPLEAQPVDASISCTDGLGHLVRFRVLDAKHVMQSVSGEEDRVIEVAGGYMIRWNRDEPLTHCRVDAGSPPGTLAFFTYGEYALVVNKRGTECRDVSYERGCRKLYDLSRDLCRHDLRSTAPYVASTYAIPKEIASLIATN